MRTDLQPPAISTAHPLILVVGMHRSGTSLLASILPPLGIALPGQLLSGDRHNPAGYGERRDVTDLQERLLIDLGRWWPSAAGMLTLPEGWQGLPCTLRTAKHLRQVLADEAERQQGAWAIKDPRSSLLLPLWRQLCGDLGIPLRLVHVVRDPAEVMVSLLRRDRESAGMTPERAQQLWWHHNTRIMEDSKELPRLVVDYSGWFDKRASEQLEDLSQFCLGKSLNPATRTAALERIKPEHRRSNSFRKLPSPIHRQLRQLKCSLIHPSSSQHAWRAASRRTPEWHQIPPLLPLEPLPELCRLEVVGYRATPCHWSIHAWLQRCPLPAGFQLTEEPAATRVGLHLQSVELSQRSGALEVLLPLALVLDPHLERVQQLRSLGVRAFWLDPLAPSSGWLDQHFDPALAAQRFGLPHPDVLARCGRVLCLGSGGDRWEQNLAPPTWALPSFQRLHVPNTEAARLLAGWLNACNRSGLQLVRIDPTDYEREGMPFAALDRPCLRDQEAGRFTPDQERALENWLPPLLVNSPLDAHSLHSELTWHLAGRPSPPPCQTPNPSAVTLWERGTSGARAAVCISLYNYAQAVLAALESVREQTHQPLELVIVDDASTDDSAERVTEWLNEHGVRFQRALLLRHQVNSGLAAARNTAFGATAAEWCFVLDADNQLEPDAVALCLSVADCSPATTAVVHPLVALHSHSRQAGQPEQALLTRIPWQREALQHGNQIDAMALVRRAHWQHVGGFTHIPEGWEDYDFWCKLIDTGLHGVICPQRLAIYNQHSSSMQAKKTRPNINLLKHILTARHPWLELETSHLA